MNFNSFQPTPSALLSVSPASYWHPDGRQSSPRPNVLDWCGTVESSGKADIVSMENELQECQILLRHYAKTHKSLEIRAGQLLRDIEQVRSVNLMKSMNAVRSSNWLWLEPPYLDMVCNTIYRANAPIGNFVEPAGVASKPNGQIIVLDAQNSRVTTFNLNGSVLGAFGEFGREVGHLMFPHKIAFCALSNNIYIVERSPKLRLQKFDEQGRFMSELGAGTFQHPKAICVDFIGRIVVVESMVMQVTIFSSCGTSKVSWKAPVLEYPNAVATDTRNQIYVSDNRAHRIRVFDYNGIHLRDIGCDKLTQYPVGVSVMQNGHVAVTTNCEELKMALFTAKGAPVAIYKSNVKHAEVLNVALISDGMLAVACRDTLVYMYKFVNLASSSLLHRTN